MNSSDSISGYGGTYEESIVNGVAFLGFTKMGPSGAVGGTLYYYKLDGSMKQPEEAIQRGGPRCSEGDMILFKASDFEGDPWRLVTWTPGSEEQYLVDFDSDYLRHIYCDEWQLSIYDNYFYCNDSGILEARRCCSTPAWRENIFCVVSRTALSSWTAAQPMTRRRRAGRRRCVSMSASVTLGNIVGIKRGKDTIGEQWYLLRVYLKFARLILQP